MKRNRLPFFCGSSRNFSKFVDLLDGVFVLDVDRETMMKRIDERVAVDPTDFGATQEERDLILRLHETKQDIPKIGNVIDACLCRLAAKTQMARTAEARTPNSSLKPHNNQVVRRA